MSRYGFGLHMDTTGMRKRNSPVARESFEDHPETASQWSIILQSVKYVKICEGFVSMSRDYFTYGCLGSSKET